MTEHRAVWKCGNCGRLTTEAPETMALQKITDLPTLGGYNEQVEEQPLRLCTVCVASAEAIGRGARLEDSHGNEVR